jgi:hypothetical protein
LSCGIEHRVLRWKPMDDEALIAACVTLISSLAHSSALKIDVTCSFANVV